MSLRIKKSKNAEIDRSQVAGSSTGRRRQPKRRQTALYSDNDDDAPSPSTVPDTKPSKRARTDELETDRDVVVADEEEVDIEEEVDEAADDTRFLPPEMRKKKQSSSSRSKYKTTARKATTKKRAVVWSDEEDEEGYDTAEQDATLQGDDQDFVPEPSRTGAAAKTKPRAGKLGKGTKVGRGGSEINVMDESRPTSATGRGTSVENEDEDRPKRDVRGKSAVAKDPTPPPVKKVKLPPIKKNRPLGPPVNPLSSSAKPLPKSTPTPTSDLTVPVPGARKPAATANNADFDLRDASVYASLFAKPSGSTPNAGLNRKEREEERRRELTKMRDEARTKRLQEMRDTFDLQASHEKVQRFVDKLISRKSAAMYPNMLGGAFRDAADRAKTRNGHKPS